MHTFKSSTLDARGRGVQVSMSQRQAFSTYGFQDGQRCIVRQFLNKLKEQTRRGSDSSTSFLLCVATTQPSTSPTTQSLLHAKHCTSAAVRDGGEGKRSEGKRGERPLLPTYS